MTKMTESNMVNVELKIVRSSNRTEQELVAKNNLPGFLPLMITSQILGLLSIILLLYWIFAYAGGLAFVSSAVIQWHAILLSVSLVYLTGTGILVFRFLRYKSKKTTKLIHASIKGFSSVLAIVAIWVTFQNRFDNNKSNLYSIHSWIGLLTFIVYLVQTIAGFLAYLYPGFSSLKRAQLLPYHRFIGLVLLALAIVSVVSGINEKAIFKLSKTYNEKNFEGVLLNFCGLLFTLFSIVIVYLATNPNYRRYTREISTEIERRTRTYLTSANS